MALRHRLHDMETRDSDKDACLRCRDTRASPTGASVSKPPLITLTGPQPSIANPNIVDAMRHGDHCSGTANNS